MEGMKDMDHDGYGYEDDKMRKGGMDKGMGGDKQAEKPVEMPKKDMEKCGDKM